MPGSGTIQGQDRLGTIQARCTYDLGVHGSEGIHRDLILMEITVAAHAQ